MNAVVPAAASPVSSPAAGTAGPGGNSPTAADSAAPADFAALLSAQLLPPEEIAALAANALHPLGEDDEQLAGEELGNGALSATAFPGASTEISIALRQDAGLAFSLPATQLSAAPPLDDGALSGGQGMGAIAADDTNKQLKELASGLEDLLGKKNLAEQTPGETALADKAALHELGGLASTHAAEPGRKPEVAQGAAAISTPLHSTQWSNDFSQKLVWMAKNDLQSAQLSINPSNLGPIEVTLSIGKDSASAHFASPFPEVRAALESALPRLKEMLAEAGVALGQADVGAQSQNRFGDGQAQRQATQSSAAGAPPTFPVADAVIATQAPRISRGIGMIDTFA